MMVGAILEVMSEESNLETATQAHNERHEMAAREAWRADGACGSLSLLLDMVLLRCRKTGDYSGDGAGPQTPFWPADLRHGSGHATVVGKTCVYALPVARSGSEASTTRKPWLAYSLIAVFNWFSTMEFPLCKP
jgi:hypothetical protein